MMSDRIWIDKIDVRDGERSRCDVVETAVPAERLEKVVWHSGKSG